MDNRNSSVAPPKSRQKLVHIVQGDFDISSDRDVVMTTVLGSCIAVCLFDQTVRVGGLNHFLLPGEGEVASGCDRDQKYGAFAMERLINALLQSGARREKLCAKIFGGAKVVNGLSDVGSRNIEFARRFLGNEGIPTLSESVGGSKARRIRFVPTTGSAKQKLLADTNAVPAPPPPKILEKEDMGDVELF